MNNIKDLAVILTQDGSEYSEPLSLGIPHEEETSRGVVKAMCEQDKKQSERRRDT